MRPAQILLTALLTGAYTLQTQSQIQSQTQTRAQIQARITTSDIPRVFIVQIRETTPAEDSRVPPKPNDPPPPQNPENSGQTEDPNLPLDAYIAQALDEQGRVEPVVWSLTDPLFRALVDAGQIPPALTEPSLEQIPNAARAAQADFTLVIWAQRFENRVRPVATLYRGAGRRQIWNYGVWERRLDPWTNEQAQALDPEALRRFQQRATDPVPEFGAVIINNNVDWDFTSRTIARTWAILTAEGPFRDFPPQPRNRLPDPAPSLTTPNNPTAEIVAPAAEREALDRAEKHLLAGRRDLAILVLRDAVDQNPFAARLRTRLAKLMLDAGLYADAAREAERAAPVSDAPADLFLVAAHAYTLANDPVRARNALNHALARGHDGPFTQALLGEVYILQSDFEKAIEAFSRSIESGPTPKAFVGRAIAFALMGDSDRCRQDLLRIADADPEALADAYLSAITLADQKFDTIASNLRELPPLLRTKPKDPPLVARAATAAIQARALAALVDTIPVPRKFAVSHRSRALAHKLIAQSALEILEFAQTEDSDLASEGTLSLGEAIRLMQRVRPLFQDERYPIVPPAY